jgi:hypothetical protein
MITGGGQGQVSEVSGIEINILLQEYRSLLTFERYDFDLKRGACGI